MKPRGAALASAVLLALAALLSAAAAAAADVVVLKGGERIDLKSPWVRQGSNALLTRSDGTLLSVPVSEIDARATAEARKAASRRSAPAIAAPAQTPVEAARIVREGPRAKVRVTDSDVSHDSMQTTALAPAEEKKETARGAARLDVAGYDQARAGANLIVRGSVRNVGGTKATNARMTISAMNENGEVIASGEASLSKGTLEPSETVAFTAAIPVGEANAASLRFSPQWLAAPLPAPPAEAAAAGARPAAAAGAGAPAASQPPAPQPTPYGQGMMYAPPPPSAAMAPPTDGKTTGYIPGAADPASQPKPPNQ